jgi:hypothetical protein
MGIYSFLSLRGYDLEYQDSFSKNFVGGKHGSCSILVKAKTNTISIEITGTKAEEVTMNFLRDLAVIQSKHASIDSIISINLNLEK